MIDQVDYVGDYYKGFLHPERLLNHITPIITLTIFDFMIDNSQ